MKRKILFLCTGNSARSQMAEGLVNHFLGDEWEAYSAGTAPAGYVGQDAILSYSKSVAEFQTAELDFIVTLCDNGARTCPLWLGSGRVEHIGFSDPAAATGSEDEQLEVFRQV
jgi:arsenate reductase